MSTERRISVHTEDKPKTWSDLSEDDRVELVLNVVRDHLDRYERDRPDGAWIAETVLELVRTGLESLQTYIEDPDEPGITWNASTVELQYPVGWTWDEREPGKAWGRPISGEVSAEDLPTQDAAAEKAAEVAQTYRHLVVLEALTSSVVEWREKALDDPDGPTAYVLPADLVRAMDEASLGGGERAKVVGELAAPFTLGGLELEDGVFVPLTEKAERWAARRAVDLGLDEPPAYMRFEVTTADGERHAGAVVVRFRPMVVDADRREAFYPVEVGLYFGDDVDPSSWPEADRRDLWDELLRGLDEAAGETTDETAETGTLPTPRVGPARTLLEAETRIDRQATELVSHAGTIRLPRRWGSIRRWDDLVQEEADRLLGEYGEDAFRAVKTGPTPRGPLLRRRHTKDGEEVVQLERTAEETLLATIGHRGFRRVHKDRDGVSREYLIRRFQAGEGYVEVRLSWYGTAALLVDEARKQEETATRKLREELEGDLFEGLDGKTQAALDSRLQWLQAVKDGRAVMEYVLGVLGRDGANPVHIPARDLRTLLECEKDMKRGHARVMGCLEALRRLDFYFRSARLGRRRAGEAMGSFLADVVYEARGAGAHTDGDFYLTVSEVFVGCLRVFSTPSYKVSGKVLDWTKTLDKETKLEGLRAGYVRRFSTLLPFYDRAKGFTPTQSRLVRFVADELTRNRDGVSKVKRGGSAGAWTERARPNAKGAQEPRTYGPAFCPLLPEGRTFHAALGHFSKNPEAGRKLAGTGGHATKTGGARTEGLLAVMGYELPPGRASIRRRRVLEEAVADLRAVVEDALGGVVAAHLGSRWLTTEKAVELPAKDLAMARWFLFPASDWRDRLTRDLEQYHADRRERGEADDLLSVTTDRGEYELANEKRAKGEVLEVEPIRFRLHRERKRRGLRQADVAKVFGVSRQAVAQWENGPDPDEDGKVRGKPIPEAMVPLLVRWIETSEEPAEDELATTRERSRKAREAARKRAAMQPCTSTSDP